MKHLIFSNFMEQFVYDDNINKSFLIFRLNDEKIFKKYQENSILIDESDIQFIKDGILITSNIKHIQKIDKSPDNNIITIVKNNDMKRSILYDKIYFNIYNDELLYSYDKYKDIISNIDPIDYITDICNNYKLKKIIKKI